MALSCTEIVIIPTEKQIALDKRKPFWSVPPSIRSPSPFASLQF